MRPAAILLALGASLAASACTVDGYCIDCRRAAGAKIDASWSDGRPPDAAIDAGAPDACVYSGPEICNGQDDDCNGTADDGVLPGVGDACGIDHPPCVPGTTECVGGAIVCGGGAVNPAPEECNNVDDDCDGFTDNGNPGGGVVCGSDLGECRHGYTLCQDGGLICDGEIAPSRDVCDTLDNDCDGVYDDDDPLEGVACGAGPGVCLVGHQHCIGGTMQCVGVVPGAPESCDHVDNDCDGLTDEDYNLDADPNNCGACGHACSVLTAGVVTGIGDCVGGECRIASCFTGRWNLNAAAADGGFSDGCEYACDYRGVEICDGLDDDCDGATDEMLSTPGICSPHGECAGATATCTGLSGWKCSYGSTVSQDAAGNIIPEADCDGRDNDCDQETDEAFPTVGDTCYAGVGGCQRAGTIVCTFSPPATYGVACDAVAGTAGTESGHCNGIDDNCDGIVDNGVTDDWVQFTGADGTTNHWIYEYEASRPDATATSGGVLASRACSASGRLPWTNLTFPEAQAACVAVGGDLCTEADWQRACEVSTTSPCTWSYSATCTTYDGTKCNGNDYAGTVDQLIPGGSDASCYASWGTGRTIFDLSGNAKEFTRRSTGKNPLRGGSYNNTSKGISCQWNFVLAGDTFHFDNVGFRCCRSTAP